MLFLTFMLYLLSFNKGILDSRCITKLLCRQFSQVMVRTTIHFHRKEILLHFGQLLLYTLSRCLCNEVKCLSNVVMQMLSATLKRNSKKKKLILRNITLLFETTCSLNMFVDAETFVLVLETWTKKAEVYWLTDLTEEATNYYDFCTWINSEEEQVNLSTDVKTAFIEHQYSPGRILLNDKLYFFLPKLF